MRYLALAMLFGAALAAEPTIATPPLPDSAAKELLRYREALAKLQKAHEEAVVKERAKTVPVLVAAAKKALAGGEMPAAVQTWKCVLELDRAHPDARAFFTSVNQLDKVLAELDASFTGPATDALGDPVEPAKPVSKGVERQVVITAEPGKAVEIGPVKAGTVLTFAYHGGRWTFRQGVRDKMSPDQAEAEERYRLALWTGEGKLITVVPPGTAAQAFSYTFTAAEPMVKLRMAHGSPPNPDGEVTYRIRMVPPR